MDSEPEGVSAPPADSGAPVQPVVGHDQVPEAWLNEGEHLAACERLDRLFEDYNLVQMLALAGFKGKDYDYFETELAKYGVAVIGGWLRRGLIFAKCRQRGFGGLREAPLGAFDDPDTVDGLTGETVAYALKHFRSHALLEQRWDYRKGATLRTFFIGQCLIQFGNVYRRWWTTEARAPHLPAELETLDDLEKRHVPSVEELVVDQVTVERTLGTVKNPRVRRAFAYRGAGLSNSEIGERLGVTEKTVERMIANERERIRRRSIA